MPSKIYNHKTRVAALAADKDAIGSYLADYNGVKTYFFTTAITSNVTTTTAASGSYAKTSHATGAGKTFRSDGSKWQDTAGVGTVTTGAAVADPAALTSAALTDSSGGTANTTVQAVGASYVQAEMANNFADLTAQHNALRVDLAATRTQLIALITALEANSVIG